MKFTSTALVLASVTSVAALNLKGSPDVCNYPGGECYQVFSVTNSLKTA